MDVIIPFERRYGKKVGTYQCMFWGLDESISGIISGTCSVLPVITVPFSPLPYSVVTLAKCHMPRITSQQVMIDGCWAHHVRRQLLASYHQPSSFTTLRSTPSILADGASADDSQTNFNNGHPCTRLACYFTTRRLFNLRPSHAPS
jgi:hypothetical protein